MDGSYEIPNERYEGQDHFYLLGICSGNVVRKHK